ncbi:MAG TPA: hemerythrin domain-containing protein [Actinoplanes sp.]|nr:hemerythrin domain-containing protein [Actinoplanes sp.]
MSHSALVADQQAAQAVIRHHSELATTLTGHVTRLIEAADAGIQRQVWHYRDELADWLHEQLLPHAYAEEVSLYPAAADLPAGTLLVEGMLGEHRVIAALVADLQSATSPVAAAAAANALQAVFASHLAKENDLVVPLLVAADDVSLAGLLDGMHDILGADSAAATAGGGCGCGGCGCADAAK